MNDFLSDTPAPPYYAVIFSSLQSADDAGYAAMAARMLELASAAPGFLGVESVRDAQGCGITVSYWASQQDIRNWKADAEHRVAQQRGRSAWYTAYRLRVCRVERDSAMDAALR